MVDELGSIIRCLLGRLRYAIERANGDFLSVDAVLSGGGVDSQERLAERAGIVWITFVATSPSASAYARCSDAVAELAALVVIEAVGTSIEATRAAVGSRAEDLFSQLIENMNPSDIEEMLMASILGFCMADDFQAEFKGNN